MRRRVVIWALLVVAVLAAVAPPVAQYLAPSCREATAQAEAAHAATMTARRRNAGDVPALYFDEAALRGYRTAQCGPLSRLFTLPAD